jgi:transposase
MNDRQFYATLLHLSRPWTVADVKLDVENERVDVWVIEDADTVWRCPECSEPVPLHDHAEERVWRHLDTCEFRTYVHARLPRTNCPRHGVRRVFPPWAEPDSPYTLKFEATAINTLKECDVSGVSRLLHLSWDEAWTIERRAVARGMRRKKRHVPSRLSIDEKSFAKRHRYETIVYDIDRGTVEFVADDRSRESLEKYFRQFTPTELAGIKTVAMDMCAPYIEATKAHVPDAAKKIVFDRFHVTRYLTEAVDKTRRQEHKELMADGIDLLKGTRHLWLANEENVPEWRRDELDVLKECNLHTARAWAIKEFFRDFWSSGSERSATTFFKRWYFWATHSRLPAVIAAAKTLKRHFPNIATFFTHHTTNATAEGINNKIQMVKEMACGFRNRAHYRIAIHFHCGGLDLYPVAGPACC